MNLLSITDSPINSSSSYNKGEVYETRYDESVDDTETYSYNQSVIDTSVIRTPSMFDYSDVE